MVVYSVFSSFLILHFAVVAWLVLCAELPLAVDFIRDGDVRAQWDAIVHVFLSPLQHGCDTKERKIVEVSLEALQRMIESGYIQGSTEDKEVAGQKLISRVVKIAEGCFDVSHKDEVVQQHILNVFSTVVEMSVCGVHESNLMTAVRICYNIYLISGEQNRKMAKQTLSHMLSLLFTRLHNATARGTLGDLTVGDDDDAPPSATSLNHSRQNSIGGFTDPSSLAAAIPATSPLSGSHVTSADEEGLEDGPLGAIGEDPGAGTPSKPPTPPPVSHPAANGASSVKRDPNDEYAYKDCFQTFRGLCKLSMKKVPPNITNLDSIEVRSKILSLELLLSVFENSAYSFAGNSRFVNNAIKKHLIMSLLMNGSSSISLVFRAVMAIFVDLVRDFREFLKVEIEVFFTVVIFPLLENSSSSLQQKIIVVRDLHTLCKTPQVLMDLFANYDCDALGKDLVEQLVKLVAALSLRKQPEVSTWGADTTEEEATLKQVSLKTLAVISKALSEWSQKLVTPSGESVDVAQRLQHPEDPVEQAKIKKFAMEQGKEIFKGNWKKGMAFFISAGLCGSSADEIARFLRFSNGLDKAMIGEYLADREPFNNTVLGAYRDLFDFTDMPIDLALREFLAYFRIPGEAQKVDRTMVAFAQRYIKDCAGTGFGNEDAVYFLAFSIIMLATDQHSTSVKTKMKKEEWKRLILGQNDGKDYDDTMLDGVFARIAAEELKLKDELPPAAASAAAAAPPPPPAPEDPAVLIERAKELMKDKQFGVPSFVAASNVHYAGLAISCVGKSLLSSLSGLLEETADEKLVAMVLEGYRLSIHVACLFDRQTELQALLGSLLQISLLENPATQEMKSKNLECTRLLLGLPFTEGDCLGESWKPVLKVLSLIEHLHSVAAAGAPKKASPNGANLLGSNAALVAQAIVSSSLDRVFTHSSSLTNPAVVKFVAAACTVSSEEIATPQPRSYMLQKLVEIAAFNMTRPRGVWAQVWSGMAKQFTAAALHQDHQIASLALDSMKQAALKFLDREELNDEEFQLLFLRPFVDVYAHESPKIRELVVHLLALIMRAKPTVLNSGWEPVFAVFGKAARDVFAIADASLSYTQEAREKHFSSFGRCHLVDYISCLGCFASDPKSPEKNTLKALSLLRTCADDLVSGAIVIALETGQNDGAAAAAAPFSERAEHSAVWISLLKGMAAAVGHPDINVRPAALEAVYQTLSVHGTCLSPELLALVFRNVLLPIFDGVLAQARSEDNLSDSEWLLTTCLKATHAILNLYGQFYDSVSFLLEDLLGLIRSFIVQENETLATFGVTSYETLLTSCSPRFTQAMWIDVAKFTASVVRESTPTKHIQLAFAADASAPEDGSPSESTSESPKLDIPLVRSPSTSPVSSPSIRRVESRSVMSPRTSIERDSKSLQTPASPANPPLSTPRSMSSSRRNRIMSVSDSRRKIALGKVRIQTLLIRAVRDRVIEQHGAQLEVPILEECLESFLAARASVRLLCQDSALRGAMQEQATVFDAIVRLETEALTTFSTALITCRGSSDKAVVTLVDTRLEGLIELLIREHLETPKDTANESGLAALLVSFTTFDEGVFCRYVKLFHARFVDLCMSESAKVRANLRTLLARVASVARFD